MTFISSHASRATLSEAVERNGVDCCLYWANWPEIELIRDERSVRMVCDVPFPFFNNVFEGKLPEENTLQAVLPVLEPFRQRSVPAFWWTGPMTRPENLGESLLAAGLQHGFEATAMAADLAQIEQEPLAFEHAVFEVESEDQLRSWADVMTSVYEFPEFAIAPWKRMLLHLGFGSSEPMRHFMATVDGKPAACSTLFLAGGVAGVSSVATYPQYRQCGLGSAVVQMALIAARNLGYEVGVLFASEAGNRMYRRMGFHEVGKGNCYIWSPGS